MSKFKPLRANFRGSYRVWNLYQPLPVRLVYKEVVVGRRRVVSIVTAEIYYLERGGREEPKCVTSVPAGWRCEFDALGQVVLIQCPRSNHTNVIPQEEVIFTGLSNCFHLLPYLQRSHAEAHETPTSSHEMHPTSSDQTFLRTPDLAPYGKAPWPPLCEESVIPCDPR